MKDFVVLEYRTLKYNKIIIIKNLYFVSFLVKVSGLWLNKRNQSLQRFKTHSELEIGTTVFLHALILTANDGK